MQVYECTEKGCSMMATEGAAKRSWFLVPKSIPENGESAPQTAERRPVCNSCGINKFGVEFLSKHHC